MHAISAQRPCVIEHDWSVSKPIPSIPCWCKLPTNAANDSWTLAWRWTLRFLRVFMPNMIGGSVMRQSTCRLSHCPFTSYHGSNARNCAATEQLEGLLLLVESKAKRKKLVALRAKDSTWPSPPRAFHGSISSILPTCKVPMWGKFGQPCQLVCDDKARRWNPVVLPLATLIEILPANCHKAWKP